jgi:small-conductance mechanosensitive channel
LGFRCLKDTLYAVQRTLVLKRLALCRFFQVKEDDMGRAELINHILNGVIVSISTLLFLDWMSIEMNKAMTGLFAFGSAGTLAFTLASKDVVTQLLSGFTLIFGNKMFVGDSVIFGDGTSGKVIKIGWLETMLRDRYVHYFAYISSTRRVFTFFVPSIISATM